MRNIFLVWVLEGDVVWTLLYQMQEEIMHFGRLDDSPMFRQQVYLNNLLHSVAMITFRFIHYHNTGSKFPM